MDDAIPVQVAETVRSMIEAATTVTVNPLSLEFTLERSYADWDLALEDATETRVDVAFVSTKIEAELAARGGRLAYTVPVDVCIRKKFGPEHQCDRTGRLSNSAIDPLVLLTQELFVLFTMRRLANDGSIVWKEDPKLLACPINKHLRELRQFTSLIRLMFEVIS